MIATRSRRIGSSKAKANLKTTLIEEKRGGGFPETEMNASGWTWAKECGEWLL